MDEQSLFGKVNKLYRIMVGHVTNTQEVSNPKEKYKELRTELLNHPNVSPHLPTIVRANDDLDECWKVITSTHDSYKERRTYLWEQFGPLLGRLAKTTDAPLDDIVSEALKSQDFDGVQFVWAKALARRRDDPEGAITIARTLLESTCKHILDELDIEYEHNIKLPKLYRLIANALSLAPDQYQEEVFKRILGGAQSIVEGLGSVRNLLSDAHGKGKAPVKPSPRHAELAVNVSGSLASFLVQTFHDRVNAT